MTISTGRDESWEAVLHRLDASTTVTDRLNAALVRSVATDLAPQLRVGISKQRLLFVSREQLGPDKSYVLASFLDAETYEFVLVDCGSVQRADRCGSAICNEVLLGFLRDLVGLGRTATEAEQALEDAMVVPEITPEPGVAQIGGWIRPDLGLLG